MIPGSCVKEGIITLICIIFRINLYCTSVHRNLRTNLKKSHELVLYIKSMSKLYKNLVLYVFVDKSCVGDNHGEFIVELHHDGFCWV